MSDTDSIDGKQQAEAPIGAPGVSRDRSSGGRTQPGERPAGMPGRIGAPGRDPASELEENERTRCEVWTRVMGYHRPVSSWNPGKQSEHSERRYFEERSSGGA